MDAIKLFFAKDWVKLAAGGLYIAINAILLTVMPEGPFKNIMLVVWSSIVTPFAIFFGIISGGTSSQVSDATTVVRSQLVSKGVVTLK